MKDTAHIGKCFSGKIIVEKKTNEGTETNQKEFELLGAKTVCANHIVRWFPPMVSRAVWLLVAAFLCSVAFEAKAMFMSYQTRQVPIDRLFANLQQRLAQNTNSFELTYDLARLHAMAYSTNLASISVKTNDSRPEFYYPGTDSGVPSRVYPPQSPAIRAQALRHLTNAVQMYERAIVLLRKSTNDIPHKEWLVLPLELGRAWCLAEAGSRKEALAGYRKALTIAWKREVTGEFSFQEWLEDKWNVVKSGNNPLRATTRRGHIGPGVCFSQEIIGYLLKLLDPVNDAKEIAELKDQQSTLNSMGRSITPILVPLMEGSELGDLVNVNAAVTFDLDGSGLPRQWGWITPKAAWLVFDPEGRGQITSALQMFGNVTFWIFWKNGYAALRSLDDNHDGVLRGTELRGIALWQDRNGDGVSDFGEVRPVADWGIVTISCAGEEDGSGVSWCRNGITFSDGKSRPSYDWIAPSSAKEE